MWRVIGGPCKCLNVANVRATPIDEGDTWWDWMLCREAVTSPRRKNNNNNTGGDIGILTSDDGLCLDVTLRILCIKT